MDIIPQQYYQLYVDYEAALSSGKSGFDGLLQGISGLINEFPSLEKFYSFGGGVITVVTCPGVKFSYSSELCLITITIINI